MAAASGALTFRPDFHGAGAPAWNKADSVTKNSYPETRKKLNELRAAKFAPATNLARTSSSALLHCSAVQCMNS